MVIDAYGFSVRLCVLGHAHLSRYYDLIMITESRRRQRIAAITHPLAPPNPKMGAINFSLNFFKTSYPHTLSTRSYNVDCLIMKIVILLWLIIIKIEL